MENVREKAAETIEGMGLSVSLFRFAGTDIRLTSGEMDVLEKLFRREPLLGESWGVWVHALNGKLERLSGNQRLNQRLRIAYAAKKGYYLVRVHE